MRKIFSAALALVCVWFATPSFANCNLLNPDTITSTTVTIPVEYGKTYVWSYDKTNYDFRWDSRAVYGVDSNNEPVDGGVALSPGGSAYTTTSYFVIQIINPSVVAVQTIFRAASIQPTIESIKNSKMMFEEGTTATAYTPYNPLCATCDGTVVSGRWNQLVQNGNFADGVNNWISETSVVANAENGVLSVTYQSSGDRGVGQVVEIGSGHKVFVSFDVDSYTGESYIGVFRGDGGSMFRSVGDAVKIDRAGHYEQVKTLTALGAGYVRYAAGAGRPVGQGAKVSFSNLNVIDLTEMFGAGNEPSTEQEAKAAIAQRANELGISATNGYYAYHANENMSSCISKIKIATTKYNETAFGPLNTALANAISVVDTVVSNTITQAGRIATLQAQKQTRPNDIADDNEKCPAGKKCLLVEDASGIPHWYEIVERYSRLPDGYTELEYIESTGTQYIDTGVTINDQYSYELRYTLNGAGQSMGGIAGKVEFRENNSGSLKGFVYGSNGAWSNENYSASDFTTTYKLQENKLYANGTLVNTFTPRTFTSTVNFNLFRRNIEPDSGFSIQYARGKLAYFKMWDENNTLVRDFIPAKNTDGKIGMYDLANGVFYENAGEGSFVAGDPVSE